MNAISQFALQNTAIALVLAMFVFALTRVWRSPPLAHLLWLLVLLKLLAPPLVGIEWSVLPQTAATRFETYVPIDAPPGMEPGASRPLSADARPLAAMRVLDREPSAKIHSLWNDARPALLWLWLAGATGCALMAMVRIVRFERRLRDMLPASDRVQRLSSAIAARFRIRHPPRVRYAECVPVPLLWCVSPRATIVLPMRLVNELDEPRLGLVLSHELAHLKRRDHWVRHIELIVATIHWWNPLVWFVRRQLHQAEDLCCDAWVRWAFPDCARDYAEVLFKTAESLTASQVGRRLLPASPFLHTLSLKARIEMILENRFTPFVSKKTLVAIVLMAVIILPAFVQGAHSAAGSGSDTTYQWQLGSSEFPYVVKFEQGATRFLEGDNITIEEVRGTAATFEPGNIYWIKGTYKLASHEKAAVAAYVTAMDSANGRSASYKVQSTLVDHGDGAFTLFLPMPYRGWPHVSFYPANGGEGFGGNYFGTAESVLKRWWGEKK